MDSAQWALKNQPKVATERKSFLLACANSYSPSCCMEPTQIWGGGGTVGVGVVGFDERGWGYLKNRSLPEQNSDHVAADGTVSNLGG